MGLGLLGRGYSPEKKKQTSPETEKARLATASPA
jgi:hypothetical protein